MDGMGAADRGGTGLGQAKKAHLALLHELRHGADRILNRRVRVDPVLIVKIDAIDLEPAQTCFAALPHVIGLSVNPEKGGLARLAHDSKFGRDDNMLAMSLQGAA